MKYLSVQTFQCGISVSGAATFTGGATINLLALNGATTSSEASLFLGAHGTNEGGQLVLQKGTSNTYAAHLDNYADQFRILYGTNTGSTGVALAVSLSTRQLILPAYTSTSSFSGTVVGYLAFDSSGNVLTTPVPAGGVTSIIAGTGVTVSSGTGNVTVSIGQSVATSASPSFDSILLTNNGNGTNIKVGDDAYIGDVNVANSFRVMGAQNGANGYIIFGNSNFDALGRSGTGNLTYAGSTVWTAATLTDLSQLTNGPGYITSAALSGYVPTSRTLTINGTSYDLSANRTWTINTVDYTSRLQHQVKAGVAINKGQAVYVTSADGTNMIVGLASNASEATSSKTMGLLDATVSTNGFANVVTEGLLAGLDTTAAGAEGDPVWLGTGGNLIYGLANKPYAPAHLVFIGIVTRKNANNGEIFVKVQNGFELKEIHDVDLITNAPTAGQLLRYNSDGLWKNWSPNYLTAEADTLATVTGRDATTNTSITVGPDLIVQADGSVNYTASRLWLNSHNNYRGAGVHMSGVGSTWFAGTPYTDFDGGYVIARTGTSNDVSSAQYSNALLTVKSNGNVGIGTSSPSYKLDVNGSFNAVTSGVSLTYNSGVLYHGGSYYQFPSGSYYYLYGRTGMGLIFGSNNAEVGRFDLSGNLGIGTTSPSQKLEVSGGDALIRNAFIGLIPAYGTNYTSFSHTSRSTTNKYSFLSGNAGDTYINASNGYSIHFRQENVDQMIITGGGNVGIGTNSPSRKLIVYDTDANVPTIGLRTDGSGTTTGDGFDLQFASSNTFLFNRESGYMSFGTSNTERMRITDVGNVGIGTSSPATNLHVVGASILANNSSINPDNYSNTVIAGAIGTVGGWGLSSAIGGNAGTGHSWAIGTNGDNLYMGYSNGSSSNSMLTFLQVDDSTRNVFLVPAAGNVGIGTATPSYKLDINGALRATGTVYSDNGSLAGALNLGQIVSIGSSFGSYANLTFTMHNGGGFSDIMKLQGNGNVGIGTTNPSHNLHIYGAGDRLIKIENTGTYLMYVGLLSNEGYIGSTNATALGFYTNNVNRIYINTSGNIGIGTTTPYEKLEVNGAISATGAVNGTSAQGHSTTLAVQSGTSFLYAVDWGAEFKPISVQAKTISLETGTGSTTSRLFIDNSGNVGIGTISPDTKLHVWNGDSGGAPYEATGITIESSGRAALNFLSGSGNDAYVFFGNSAAGNAGYVGYENTANRLVLRSTDYISLLDSTGEVIRIDNGNVGIGTTSPTQKLDVAGGDIILSSNATYIRSKDASGNTPRMFGINPSNDTYIGPIDSYAGGAVFYGVSANVASQTFYTGATARLHIASGGNVGIGTTDPQYKLDVAQVIRSKYGSNEGGIYLGGTPAGVAYVAGAVRATPSPSYSYTGKLSFYTTTWGVGTDYGITEQMYIDVTGSDTKAATLVMLPWGGNVGIGTTAPAQQLHVTQNIALGLTGGSIGDTNNILFPTVNGTHTYAPNGIFYTKKGNWGGQIDIRTSYDWGYATDNAKISLNGAEGNGIVFYTGASALGASERVRITATGNVAINTTDSNLAKVRIVGEGGVGNAAIMSDYGNTAVLGEVSTIAHRGGQWHTLYVSESGGSATNAVYVTGTKPVILNAGNVGIGTTSPSYKLDVQGNSGLVTINTNGALSAGGQIISGSGEFASSSSGTDLNFRAGATHLMVLKTSGNVGIGTTSPTNRLQIGSIGSSGYGGNDLAIGNGTQVMAFYQSTTVSTWYTNTSFSLMPSGSGSVGNLGVGTDSPTQRVHVSGNLRVTGAFYDSNNQAGSAGQILKSTGSGTDWVSLSEITGVDGSGTANYVTKWSDADTVTNSLIYDNGTNVGIGTTSPGYNFDVNGQVRVQDKLRVGTVNSGNGVVHMSSSATINPNTTTIVWAQNVSVGMCAFIEYYILNDTSLTDQRAGTIMVTWNQSGTPTIAHTETTTPDIGSTIAVNFTSSLVGSDARINAVNSSANPYTIVMSYKYF